MGLHLNFELRLPGATSAHEVDRLLADLHAHATAFPFKELSPIHRAGVRKRGEAGAWIDFWAGLIAKAFDDESPLVGDTTTARGFLVHPGTGCETATFGFLARAAPDGSDQEWFWYCACKTQYAAVESDAHLVFCHTSLVALLDYAIALGIDVVVRDETHYWETRSTDRLVEEVRAMNRIIASFAGALSDAMGDAHTLEAPIFKHPEFERLEMEE